MVSYFRIVKTNKKYAPLHGRAQYYGLRPDAERLGFEN